MRCLGGDGDDLAEWAARIVGLDGEARRCPWVFCLLFGIPVKPLPRGRCEGYFDARRLVIYLDMGGDETEVRARLAHEVGHVILFLAGHLFPHDEGLASRVGRAWGISRRAVLRAMREFRRDQVLALHCDFFPPEETSLRIWEVQGTLRSVG